MKINQIIKEKRKEQGLTQEQVAEYLGVSAPAVSKWEKGGTYPDITLLPPLARLLKVDLNTLLSFQDDLSEQEIGQFTNSLVELIKEEGYAAGFATAMAKIREYPGCDQLSGATAPVLEGALTMFAVEDKGIYAPQIDALYERAARSEDARVRYRAVIMLIAKYRNRGDYEKAQKLLDGLPDVSFGKKQAQASLHLSQGKYVEAAELLERKLLSEASEMHSTLLQLLDIALKESRDADAQHLAEMAKETAKLYDLWEYTVYVAGFQLAAEKQDAAVGIPLLRAMLAAMQKPWKIGASLLYRHITPESVEKSFTAQLISVLLTELQTDDQFAFLRSDPAFPELLREYRQERRTVGIEHPIC